MFITTKLFLSSFSASLECSGTIHYLPFLYMITETNKNHFYILSSLAVVSINYLLSEPTQHCLPLLLPPGLLTTTILVGHNALFPLLDWYKVIISIHHTHDCIYLYIKQNIFHFPFSPYNSYSPTIVTLLINNIV